jgi:hypothetical protein
MTDPKDSRQLDHPVFAQPEPTPDPTQFLVKHPSDGPAYSKIDELNKEHKIHPLPFPAPRGGQEPVLSLQQVLNADEASMKTITDSGQIVFHALGDCGSTQGPQTENLVTDKLASDFNEAASKDEPKFNFLLGDIVYSFGESQYYYDQFYDPYRDYPAPILAAAGNHDGMVSPLARAKSLDAFLRNFCSEKFTVTPEAGGLSRTAQIQPGVFFTFDAPFVRILALYSNTLEDPGVIADGDVYQGIGTSQLDFLRAALTRCKTENYAGALLIASHHPAYTVSRHGWSELMAQQIDGLCKEVGFWPHAFLAGHAHNYQRFTRTRTDGTQIPYLVCGNGGHNVQKLTKGGTLRAPQIIQKTGANTDQIVFENYDDTDYGYLRVLVTASQLRVEYHPASDGSRTKTPDDSVTVDIQKRVLVQYDAPDLGRTKTVSAIRKQIGIQEHFK